MSATRVYLAKFSACECGYPLLDERIQPGPQTDYYASPDRVVTLTLVCGGCKKEKQVRCWFIHEKLWPWGTSRAGFLPAEVFEVLP
jgi:hypothetical protein